MTLPDGEHAENPEQDTPKKFEFFPTEVLERIELTRQRVIEAEGDRHKISQAVDSLNNELVLRGFIGREAQLGSEFATVISRGLNDDESDIVPVFDPDVLLMTSFEGSFVGCEAIITGNETELVYHIELPLDEDTLRFRTVTAPVDMTSMKIEVTQPVLNSEEDEEEDDLFYKALEIFSTISDQEVLDSVQLLKECYEMAEEFNASFIRGMAIVANHMMTYPEVKDNEAMVSALENLFTGVVDLDFFYLVKGIDARVSRWEKEYRAQATSIDIKAQVQGIGLIHNFDYDPKSAEAAQVHQDYQIAYVMLDAHRVEYIVPAQYLVEFIETEVPKMHMDYCEEARYRFLKVHPSVFSELNN